MSPAHWIYKIPLRLRSLFRHRQVEAELDEELRYHLDQLIADEIGRGRAPEEARYAALRRMDGLEQRKEECRDARGVQLIGSLWQDLRYAARTLRKTPGFAAVAVLSLALGIGANTAIFTLIDAAMLRPPAGVQNPEGLVRLSNPSFSYPVFQELRSRHLFAKTVAFDLERTPVTKDGTTGWAQVLLASGDYYSMLGVRPLIGRVLTPEDDKLRAPVAVLAYRTWQEVFAGDPSILGSTVRINHVPITIVGVTPPEFTGLIYGIIPDFTVPLMVLPQIRPEWDFFLTRGTTHWLDIVARLEPGQSIKSSNARLQVEWPGINTAAEIAAHVPAGHRGHHETSLLPVNGFSRIGNRFGTPLFVLMGLVGVVLLLACANVANLFLARGAARRREFAVRLALGAGRGRLIRQMLTESLLIAGAAGAAGILFAFWSGNLLIAFISTSTDPVFLNVHPGVRVLLFTVGVTILTALLFGAAPAFRSTRVDSGPSLKEHGRSLGAVGGKLGKALVIAQVALSLLLVVGAGLFLGTLRNIFAVDPGFRPENMLLVTLDAVGAGFRGSQGAVFYSQLLDRVRALPGVRAAGASWAKPVSMGRSNNGDVSIAGYTPRQHENMVVLSDFISPGYFVAIRQPLLAGRDFNARDKDGAPKVVIINQTMAHRFFLNENPIGRRIDLGEKIPGKPRDYQEIVGVVKDAKYSTLKDPPRPVAYVPYAQSLDFLERWNLTLEIRSAADPTALANAMRREIQTFSRNIPVETQTLESHIDESLTGERLIALLSGFFGALALLLASLGLYGILAYAVTRRTAEIGIRMALGAQRWKIVWMMLRESIVLVCAGLAIGIPAALAATRLVSSLLFGVGARDVVTFVTAGGVLIAVALLASWIPARRAARVDPLTALRYE